MSELPKNTILYVPEKGEIKGVVQIIHGMAEYQGRFREFAQFLTRNGYAVVTSDLRGHGNHISRESDLGFFGDNAVSRLVGDIHEITIHLRNQFPGKPVFLLGHGIGALIATNYIKKYDNFLDGLFLSGMPADKTARYAANLLVMLFIAMRGEYHRSSLINYLIMGRYYRPFAAEGSEFSWLSADPDIVVKYEINPKCGYVYTLNGFKTILDLMNGTYSKGSWIRKNPQLPIRMFWGQDDTVISGRSDLSSTVHLFSDNGYTDVGYIIYPGQRHEVFQDYTRENVYSDALNEMDAICLAGKAQEKPVKKTSKHIVLENFIDPEVDRPLVKDEKLDLDELISTHKPENAEKDPEARPKVEMIDFADIEAMINEAVNAAPSETKAEPAPVSGPASAPEPEPLRPLDTFDGFKIDPNITDGLTDAVDAEDSADVEDSADSDSLADADGSADADGLVDSDSLADPDGPADSDSLADSDGSADSDGPVNPEEL